jgi:hypothetical protein
MATPNRKTVIRKETGPWTASEYAALYAVSRATVYSWFGKGWLGSSKIGGCRRILPEHDIAFRARFTAQGGSHE